MLTDLLRIHAGTTPHAIAVGHAEYQLTYEELLGRANSFARLLAQHDIGRGNRVALLLPKSIDALVAYVGVLLAGSVLVPIDPRLPPPRVCQVLDNCAPLAVVSNCATLDRLSQHGAAALRSLALVVTDSPCTLNGARGHDFQTSSLSFAPRQAVSDEDPAYVLYTSGTTGEPKGVVHSHRSAVCFVDWAMRAFDIRPGARLCNCAQWSFDLSILDLWAALSSGARVDLVPLELLWRPQEFVRRLRGWGTTHLYAVPSTIGLLESDGKLRDQPLPELAHVLYAGEPFSIARLRSVMQALPEAQFHNLFGPTETNVCTHYPLPGVPKPSEAQVSIGRACDHLNVELLDADANPVGTQTEGELCVSGASVMSEYFQRPIETRRAFFDAGRFDDGRARYRTGDFAVRDDSGLLWFRGRRDRMVKRRGYRIELGELEAAIGMNLAVAEAAAYAKVAGENTEICLAVALHADAHHSPIELKMLCGQVLPSYMLPDSIQIVDQLPRTPNGKVDLQRLADPSGVKAKITHSS